VNFGYSKFKNGIKTRVFWSLPGYPEFSEEYPKFEVVCYTSSINRGDPSQMLLGVTNNGKGTPLPN
jgi:hypothetical protein